MKITKRQLKKVIREQTGPALGISGNVFDQFILDVQEAWDYAVSEGASHNDLSLELQDFLAKQRRLTK
jgi:hypothetical protein